MRSCLFVVVVAAVVVVALLLLLLRIFVCFSVIAVVTVAYCYCLEGGWQLLFFVFLLDALLCILLISFIFLTVVIYTIASYLIANI